MTQPDNFVQKLIRVTMRPFIRLLLRYGVGYGDFSAIVKELFVEVADEHFRIDGRKQTISRISVLTGITRREIKKILSETPDTKGEYFIFNHAARIITSWLHDKEFQDCDGKAAGLATGIDGPGTFNALVRKYGNNTPSRAILDELIRVGAVETDDNGVAKMLSLGYVPTKDSQEMLSLSLQSVADHISTIDYNDTHKPADSRLQLTVNYDNVTDDGVEVFKQISQAKSKEILLFLDRFLSTQDRDSNQSIDGTGTNRTGLGIFYYEEARDPDPNDKS